MLVDVPLYVSGTALPPYTGEWKLLSEKRYPDAVNGYEDAQLFECYAAKDGDPLSLADALRIEQMIRDKVAEENGGALETRIYTRLVQLPSGQARNEYRLLHAAHASPVAWALVVIWIAANWKAVLITLGVAAAVAALITFTIKSTSIIWKAGDKIEDLVEDLPPIAVAGLGLGILLIVVLLMMGGLKKKESAA
ncbi:hypothetical protein ES705_14574 [subsurface metagenome]